MNAISSALSHVTLGLEATVKNLSMFPLLGDCPQFAPGSTRNGDCPPFSCPPFSPLTLDDALSSGWAQITEISEAGSVPELRVVNKGDRAVFILDGEELLGARQNRIVNLSILVPAVSSLTIPVSCVEAGRWHARSRSFTAAPRVQYGAARAKRVRQVTESMLCTGARMSDQAAVWEDIAEKSRRLKARSETSAMAAMYVDHAVSIDEFVDGLAPFPGQVGALFTIGERIAGLDLFTSDTLLRKLLPKIVRSYALDAIDPDEGAPEFGEAESPRRRAHRHGTSRRTAAEHFIHRCATAEGKSVPALGLGEDVRIEGRGLSAAALVYNEQVVHLSAFAV
jgi:hypothetical protein